jgi:hypothetical protein
MRHSRDGFRQQSSAGRGAFGWSRTGDSGPPPGFVDRLPERVHWQSSLRTASRRPHRDRKLTTLIPATSENVAAPYCSDEREMNSQKTERGACGVAKF